MTKAEKDNQRIIRAMSAVAFDFECFLYSDVKDGAAIDDTLTIRESTVLCDLIPNWKNELDFFNKVYLLIDYFVVPEERNKVIDLTSKQRIFSKLENAPYTYVYAQCSNGDFTKTFFMKFCAVRDENGVLTGIILGLKDINDHVVRRNEEEKEKEKIKDAMKALTDDYEALFLVDAANDIIKDIRRTNFYKNYFAYERISNNYTARINEAIGRTIDEEDQVEAQFNFSLEHVKEVLAEQQSFHFIYKMKKRYGRHFTCRAKFARLTSDDTNHFVLGIRFADYEIVEKTKINMNLITKTEEAKKTIDYQLQTLQEKNNELETINFQIIDMLGSVAELRDKDTGMHIAKVKGYSKILAAAVAERYPEYNLTSRDVELISSASVLHDIGKIMVPDSILLKPAKLTPEEFEIMKKHCENGIHILDMTPANWSAEFIHFSKEICLGHHEKWDGKGYPQGLKGDEIPISAQIVSLVDCFDALSAKRVYKDAYPPTTAYDMIMEGKCGVFSPKILDCFTQVKDKFFAFEKSTNEQAIENEVERKRVHTNKYLVVNDETIYTIKQLTADLPVGFCLFKRDNETSIVYFNKALHEMYGCETSEGFRAHVNNSLLELVDESNRDALRKDMNNKLLYNEILTFDGKGKKFNGEPIYIKMTGKKAYSSKGNDLFYMFILDKTHKIMSAELESSINDLTENRKKISRIEDTEEENNSFQGIRVLIVEPSLDYTLNDSKLKKLMENEGAFVAQVNNGYSAASLLVRDSHFDAIIINKNNADIDVIDTMKTITIIEGISTRKVPIIVITNEKSNTLNNRYLDSGANCVLSTPITATRLSKALISSMKSRSFEMENKLADTIKKASIDPLTHVKNSSAFADRSAFLDIQIKDKKTLEFAIVLCDINNLKQENDKYGHSVGDIYIRNCCRVICDVFSNSPVYRIGGDEFVVILTEFELKNKKVLCDRLKEKIAETSKLEHSRNGKADFAFGIADFDPETDHDVVSVLKKADKEMYNMKADMKR